MRVLKKCTKFITAILVQATVFIVLLELAGRLFDPAGISYFPEMARYLDTMIIEEPIGYRNRPGLKGDYFGVPVSINRFGLRNDDLPVQKAANEFRILLLGDSVPFGIGVSKDHMLSSQLQDMLNKDPQSGVNYSVLNMGVPSYNTGQELVQLENTGLKFNPDIVLLLFSSNDIESKMWVFEKRSGKLADIIQRSYAGSLIFLAYRELQGKLPKLVRSASASTQGKKLQKAFHGYHATDDRWKSTRNAMLEISEILKERGIPFVLLLNNGKPALNALWKREARRGEFLVSNLKPWKDPRWKNDDKNKYKNSYVDGHPNIEGNAILATMIYELLVTMGLLPSS